MNLEHVNAVKVLDLEGNLLFMSSGGQQLLEIDNIDPYLNGCWIDFWAEGCCCAGDRSDGAVGGVDGAPHRI